MLNRRRRSDCKPSQEEQKEKWRRTESNLGSWLTIESQYLNSRAWAWLTFFFANIQDLTVFTVKDRKYYGRMVSSHWNVSLGRPQKYFSLTIDVGKKIWNMKFQLSTALSLNNKKASLLIFENFYPATNGSLYTWFIYLVERNLALRKTSKGHLAFPREKRKGNPSFGVINGVTFKKFLRSIPFF